MMASVNSVISRSAQRFRFVNSKVEEGREEGGWSWEGVCACMDIVGGNKDLGWSATSIGQITPCRRFDFPRPLILGSIVPQVLAPNGRRERSVSPYPRTGHN